MRDFFTIGKDFGFATLAVTFLGVALDAAPVWADPKPVISVTGEASISAAPDMAMISIGVEARGATAAAAMSENSALMSKVVDGLKAAGVEAKDLQTSGLSLNRDQRMVSASGEALPVDFVAHNMVTVSVRDLDGLGALLDALVADGANNLNGISFALEEPRPLLDEARKMAVQDARARAELLAQAAGVRLGKLLSINEGGGYGGPGPRMMRAEASDAPIERGEVSYSANVSMTWEIKE